MPVLFLCNWVFLPSQTQTGVTTDKKSSAIQIFLNKGEFIHTQMKVLIKNEKWLLKREKNVRGLWGIKTTVCF